MWFGLCSEPNLQTIDDASFHLFDKNLNYHILMLKQFDRIQQAVRLSPSSVAVGPTLKIKKSGFLKCAGDLRPR